MALAQKKRYAASTPVKKTAVWFGSEAKGMKK
jgi:hypothetical protein